MQLKNGGSVSVHALVDKEDSDYNKLVAIAKVFAKMGKEVKLTPKMKRPPQFEYEEIYCNLVGTRHERKCPDLNVSGFGMSRKAVFQLFLKTPFVT